MCRVCGTRAGCGREERHSIMATELDYPYVFEQIRDLRLGQAVSLSGTVCTARDSVHRHLFEKRRCAVNLRDAAVFHCGPLIVGAAGAWTVRAAGPTTSMRLEPYTPFLIAKYGIRVILGKGGMGEGTRRACAEHGCIYVQAVGGAAALLGRAVRRVVSVEFLEEFGSAEALWVLEVEHLEGVVTMDARGGSLHRRVRNASRRALRGLLRDGGTAPVQSAAAR